MPTRPPRGIMFYIFTAQPPSPLSKNILLRLWVAMDNVAFYIFLCLELCYCKYAYLFYPVMAMHALFVYTLLVGCPMVIVLGCICPRPSNNNNYTPKY